MIKKIMSVIVLGGCVMSACFALHGHAEISNVSFALKQLEETCALDDVDHFSTVEDIELTHYCLSTGKVIALQAAASAEQIAQVKFVVARWEGNLNALLPAHNPVFTNQ
jgi:hypothetical protein